MNKYFILLSLTLSILVNSCKNDKQKTTEKSKKAVNNIYFDTSKINDFFSLNKVNPQQQTLIKLFYSKRNNAFVWFNDLGINIYATNFIAILNIENKSIEKDTIISFNNIVSKYNFIIKKETKFNNTDADNIAFELLMTISFFDYCSNNFNSKIDNQKILASGWLINKKDVGAIERLDIFLKNDAIKNPNFEPAYRQYALLKKMPK